MCTSIEKGGRRCAAHIGEALDKAKSAFEANPSDETNKAVSLLEHELNGTPTGIKALREAGNHEAAKRFEIVRDIQVKEQKAKESQDEAEKAAEEAIKQAKLDYARSPEGIAKLRAAGKHELADRFETEAYQEGLRTDALSNDADERECVANDRRIPADVAAILAKDPHPAVVDAISRNTSTPAEVLLEMAKSEHRGQRIEIAHNPGTPWQLASKLLSYSRFASAELMLSRNNTTPSEMLEDLAGSKNEQVRDNAKYLLEQRANHKGRTRKYDSRDENHFAKLASSSAVADQEEAASSWISSSETVTNLLSSEHPSVRNAAVLNRNVKTQELYDRLKDSDPTFVSNAYINLMERGANNDMDREAYAHAKAHGDRGALLDSIANSQYVSESILEGIIEDNRNGKGSESAAKVAKARMLYAI
jgi:hypothetical protein